MALASGDMRVARGLSSDHPVMMRVLSHRLAQSRLYTQLWGRQGLRATLEHIIAANDLSIAADALRGIFGAGMSGRGATAIPAWGPGRSVTWLGALAQSAGPLLSTESEEHVTVGVVACECAEAALRPLFEAVRAEDGGDAPASDAQQHDTRQARWAARSAEPHVGELCRALEGARGKVAGRLGERCGIVSAKLGALMTRAEAGLGSTLAGDAMRAALAGGDSDDDGSESGGSDDNDDDDDASGGGGSPTLAADGKDDDDDDDGSGFFSGGGDGVRASREKPSTAPRGGGRGGRRPPTAAGTRP